MVSWKHIPEPSDNAVELIPWLASRNFFAVDASGSTAWNSVLESERSFVEAIRRHPEDHIAKWGSSCEKPTNDFSSVTWKADKGGTSPSLILKDAVALERIRKSDAWFLLTDGQVFDREVNELAELAMEKGVLNVPVVFVITGCRGSTPETTDISVGISFFANSQDTLILFKEVQTGKIYIIGAKGCFAALASTSSSRNLTRWDELAKFKNEKEFFEHCETLDLSIPKYEARGNLPQGVSLGCEWERAHNGPVYVDLDALLNAGVLPDEQLSLLLAEEAFSNLSVAYKTRRRIPDLRPFITTQKVPQVVPQLEDISGAAAIISHMGEPGITPEQKRVLQERLREAHTKNREHYQSRLADLSTSEAGQRIRKRNQLVDAALRQLSDIEAAGFTAEILARSSNRARRAAVVSSDTTSSLANLNFDVPSYKGYCLVCCGEEEAMSICLKVLDHADAAANTTDFALNFPLAAGSSPANVNIISSQNVCFQCALLGPSSLSIYKEQLAAIIPAMAYQGSNKTYINQQLYRALTSSLQTGASGLSQLFMAILEQVVQSKSWAGATIEGSNWTADEQNEAIQRRATFQWMIANMLENTSCRETFSELGDWVLFPKALQWVARDYETQGLASFAITYPVAGFMHLMTFGRKSGAFSEELISSMKISKVLHSPTSAFLAKLLKEGSVELAWHQPFLEMIYKEFNADIVPRDLGGPQSLVSVADQFWQKLCACLSQSSTLLSNWTKADQERVMCRAQVLIFWLIFYQKGHTAAQTFFSKVKEDHPIATTVLDPKAHFPASLAHSVLLSPFLGEEKLINPDVAALHHGVAPFKTPFGPSVLHCAYERCSESFVPSTEAILASLAKPPSLASPQDDPAFMAARIELVRKARAQHLIKAFGIRGRFEENKTGLPEATLSPTPPSSTTCNLHVNIARTWAELSTEERRSICTGGEALEAFIVAARKRICAGRRGNIFYADIDSEIRGVLPSFFHVLGKALKLEAVGETDIAWYQHEFKDNNLEWKMEFESATAGQ